MKRIVSIQDISCIGKCSQTVALPILSSMGIETAILPTSVLSTHTAFNAMADHGRMYAGIDKNIFSKIKEVAKKADVIRLNLTEATFLLDMKYKENFTLEEGKDIAKRLQQLGGKITVITGIEKENEIGAIGYDGNKFYSNFETKYNKSYHGTGDIFTSALVGSILREKNLEESIKIATKFTTECVRTTYEDENGIEYGVNFELVIPYLLELL